MQAVKLRGRITLSWNDWEWRVFRVPTRKYQLYRVQYYIHPWKLADARKLTDGCEQNHPIGNPENHLSQTSILGFQPLIFHGWYIIIGSDFPVISHWLSSRYIPQKCLPNTTCRPSLQTQCVTPGNNLPGVATKTSCHLPKSGSSSKGVCDCAATPPKTTPGRWPNWLGQLWRDLPKSGLIARVGWWTEHVQSLD